MLLDFILIKENSTELVVIGDYNNDFEFFADNIQIFPEKINRMWRLDRENVKYVNDTYRIILSKKFSILKIKVNNCDINLENFKNLRKGKYEYHKYRMHLDRNNIYIHKKYFIRRR